MAVLKECPAYEDCLLWFRTNGFDKEFFRCDGCTSYKCYELGFMEGVKEAVKKINELPEPMLRPMTAQDERR